MVLGGCTADGAVILFLAAIAFLGAHQPGDPRIGAQLCRRYARRQAHSRRTGKRGAVGGRGAGLRGSCAGRGGLTSWRRNLILINKSEGSDRAQGTTMRL